MGLWSHAAERPVGCSCLRSIQRPFPSRSLLSPKNKEWGQINTCSWFWIKLAGTSVPIFRFLKGCISCSCHLIRQSCNQQNACGPSQTNLCWLLETSVRKIRRFLQTDVSSAMTQSVRQENGTSRISSKSGRSMRCTEGSSQHITPWSPCAGNQSSRYKCAGTGADVRPLCWLLRISVPKSGRK
jgi:hypothetical protein